jgi:hypothetical protein
MKRRKERYLTDAAGNRTAVVLDISEYEQLLADAEALEEIRAYDEAKASGDPAAPLDDAVARIERQRQ